MIAASALARIVADRDVEVENAALIAGDARWVRPVGRRAVSAGLGLTYADALPIGDPIGSRTFRNLGADGLLVLRPGDDRALTLAVGVRAFAYKPDRDFDWAGPVASARLELPLWQAPGGTRSLELVATLGAEARAYASNALASACPPGAPPDPDCSAGTSLPRRDRYQRAGVEVTWVGGFVAAAGYGLTVVDSNSFGQSIVRHKATLSATRDLPWKLYGTALVTLQLDQYLDGLVVERDLQSLTFSNLDDENRSSLQLRLARAVSPCWSLEGRAAAWRDFGGDPMAEFHRELIYVGAIYNR